MNRMIGAVIGLLLAGSVMAQSSFTIVRPADGSKVREKIRVMIPKNSIDQGSYVGVFLGGKFIEAVVPPIVGNYRVYTLDTKARKIADGELKLELVKYVDYQDQPRIVDRSSVTVTVGNQANIPVSADGIKLRYGFQEGREYVYGVEEAVSISAITGIDNSLGGRAAEIPAGDLRERIMYAVDSKYGNGDALLRTQLLPDKGKDYAIVALLGEPEPRQVFSAQMQPVYMRVTKTGIPVFGSVPPYFGFSSGGAAAGGTDVFGAWPLPVLPERAVKPGSSWQTRYQIQDIAAAMDPNVRYTLNRVTQSYQARGEFIAAEWEMGHPCAKIRNSIAAGTRSFDGQSLEGQGRAFGDDKVELEELIWFALDTKQILKRIRTMTIDQKVTVAGPTNPGGAPGGQPGAPNRGAAGGGKLGPGGGGRADDGLNNPGSPTPIRQGSRGGLGTKPAGGGLSQGPGRTGAPGGGSRVQYIRQRYRQTFILEK